MIFKFQRSATMTTVEYVKCMLPMLGNIVQFEVYRDEKESPYTAIEHGEKKYYSFILQDEKGNEFWLDTLCGYGGSSPAETESILQILGIRDDYGITQEGNSHILHKALSPNHSFNLLLMDQNNRELLLATMNFRYAHQRWATLNAINSFGYIKGAMQGDSSTEIFPASHYQHDFGDYATNMYLYLDKEYAVPEYSGFKLLHVKTMINSIVSKNLGEVSFLRVLGMGKEKSNMLRFDVTITTQTDTEKIVVFADSHRDAIHQIKEEDRNRLQPDALVVVNGARASKRYRISVNLSAVELAEYNY